MICTLKESVLKVIICVSFAGPYLMTKNSADVQNLEFRLLDTARITIHVRSLVMLSLLSELRDVPDPDWTS